MTRQDIRTDSKAVIESRLVHDVHRRSTTLLADAAARRSVPTGTLAELRDFVVETLHHHHESEDEQLWPLITARAPALADPLGDLTRDHDLLDAALDALDGVVIDDEDRAVVIEAAVAVRDLVHRHLDDEEPLLFPALREHVSEKAWDAFSADVIATAPTERVFLLIALFDEVGSAEEVDLVLGHLPQQAREFVPVLREQGRTTLAILR